MDRKFTDFPKEILNNIRKSHYGWFVDGENHDYIAEDIIHISKDEVQEFKEATAEAHDMYCAAVAFVIKHKKYDELGIPPNMIELIEYTWKHNHEHIVGRFDIAGGLQGKESKILEYNADMPTMLVESIRFQDIVNEKIGRIQYKGQFNLLEAKLIASFKDLVKDNRDKHPSILFTTLGYEEDKLNASVVQYAADQAGMETAYADLEEVHFADDGVFLETETGEFLKYDFLFKLVPWEFIALEEPDLMTDLTMLVTQGHVKVINPAYSILFQSKGILKYLYDLNKDNPIVLKTTFDPSDFDGKAYVKKVMYGRLGENITIYGVNNDIVEQTEGDFDDEKYIYQEFTNLYNDGESYYQAGIYFADNSPCCLSFRANDNLIMDDDSEFVPHIIE